MRGVAREVAELSGIGLRVVELDVVPARELLEVLRQVVVAGAEVAGELPATVDEAAHVSALRPVDATDHARERELLREAPLGQGLRRHARRVRVEVGEAGPVSEDAAGIARRARLRVADEGAHVVTDQIRVVLAHDGGVDAREREERRREVDEAHEVLRDGAAPPLRMPDDEGHAAACAVGADALPPQPVGPEVLAVVRREDDDGALVLAGRAQSREQAAELAVGVTKTVPIEVLELAGDVLGGRVEGPEEAVPDLEVLADGGRSPGERRLAPAPDHLVAEVLLVERGGRRARARARELADPAARHRVAGRVVHDVVGVHEVQREEPGRALAPMARDEAERRVDARPVVLEAGVRPVELLVGLALTEPVAPGGRGDGRAGPLGVVSSFASNLDVALLDGNGRILSEVTTDPMNLLATDALLYGVVTPDPGEFGFLENVSGGRIDTAVAFLDLADLPEKPSAWNALDILVIHDSDSGQLSVDQQESLAKWVDTGGQLVITGGGSWQKSTAVFQDQLPVTITGSESVGDLPNFRERIGVEFRDPGPYVIATSSLSSGELIYHEDGLPILARQPVGRGSVYFLALDPILAPLLDWDGSEELWGHIANQVPAVTLWGQGPQNSYSASNAVRTLNVQNLPSIWQIALLMAIYIVVIGPINYLVLKRRNQTERAWITIPLLVLMFSGIAYLIGFQLRGDNARLNQMDVVYSQVNSEYGRANSLLGLYSPSRTTYDLIFREGALARPFDSNFNSDLSGGGNIDAVTYGNDVTITGIRIDISDIATFVGDNTIPAIELTGEGLLTVEGNNIRANITVQNQSDTPLETVSLLIGNQIYAIGDMSPGATETINQSLTGSPATNSPFTSNVSTILDSFDYYDDPQLYPRYQLLESMESGTFNTSVPTQTSNDTAYILAWSDGAQIDVVTGGGDDAAQATTFHVVEIPLAQNLIGGDAITVPSALLNWRELDSSGLYNASIEDLYLNDGWIEFEYEPWPEFQNMDVTELSIMLEAPDGETSAILPDVRIWDWQEEIWVEFDVRWGETAVPNKNIYLGPGNIMRIRLADNSSSYSKTVDAVYPVLMGSLEP